MLLHEIELKVHVDLKKEASKLDLASIKRPRTRKKFMKQGKARHVWCRSWLLKRPSDGQCNSLMTELASDDAVNLQNFLRAGMNLLKGLLKTCWTQERGGHLLDKISDTFFTSGYSTPLLDRKRQLQKSFG